MLDRNFLPIYTAQRRRTSLRTMDCTKQLSQFWKQSAKHPHLWISCCWLRWTPMDYPCSELNRSQSRFWPRWHWLNGDRQQITGCLWKQSHLAKSLPCSVRVLGLQSWPVSKWHLGMGHSASMYKFWWQQWTICKWHWSCKFPSALAQALLANDWPWLKVNQEALLR